MSVDYLERHIEKLECENSEFRVLVAELLAAIKEIQEALALGKRSPLIMWAKAGHALDIARATIAKGVNDD